MNKRKHPARISPKAPRVNKRRERGVHCVRVVLCMPLRGGAHSPWGKPQLLHPTQALMGETSAHREQVGKPCLCIQPMSQQGALCLAWFSFSSLPHTLQQPPTSHLGK